MKLSAGEALSVYLALRRFIRQTSKAPFFFISAIQKIALVLKHADLTAHLAESSVMLDSERRAAADHAQIWETLMRGWREHIVIRLSYEKPREDILSEHEFEPYLFEPAVGVYVIGWSRTRHELRTFKIDRIRRATLTVARFEKPERFTPDDLLKHAWGVYYGKEPTRIELLFAPDVAKSVQETLWHPSQYLEVQADGSLYWRVEVAGSLELVPWIRGWGHEVEVLGPEWLRGEIASSLTIAANLYNKE